MIVMVERTRVMDKLFIAHGVKLADLQRAIVEFDLENDEKVKYAKSVNLASREQLVKIKTEKMMEEIKVNPEQTEEVKEVCKEAGEIDSTPDLEGLLAFDEYLKIFRIVVILQVRFLKRIDDEHKLERRAALEVGDQKKFAETASKMLGIQQKAKQGVTLCVLQQLDIPAEIYDKTGRSVKESPEKGL